MNIPEIKVKNDTTRPQIINGFKYRLYEIPELKTATTSELLDNLDVNQITDKKTKIGIKKYP
tara:strand:- start:30 stop:215 length:186 start_codon:yes stop_codon:yes gene_type:complete